MKLNIYIYIYEKGEEIIQLFSFTYFVYILLLQKMKARNQIWLKCIQKSKFRNLTFYFFLIKISLLFILFYFYKNNINWSVKNSAKFSTSASWSSMCPFPTSHFVLGKPSAKPSLPVALPYSPLNWPVGIEQTLLPS